MARGQGCQFVMLWDGPWELIECNVNQVWGYTFWECAPMQVPQFWPHGPNFGPMDQIWPSFSNSWCCGLFGSRKLYLAVKSGPVWKFQIFDPRDPQGPELAPHGPGTQRGAWIILVQSNDDRWWQGINFGKGQLFLCFFHWSDPWSFENNNNTRKFLLRVGKRRKTRLWQGWTLTGSVSQLSLASSDRRWRQTSTMAVRASWWNKSSSIGRWRTSLKPFTGTAGMAMEVTQCRLLLHKLLHHQQHQLLLLLRTLWRRGEIPTRLMRRCPSSSPSRGVAVQV